MRLDVKNSATGQNSMHNTCNMDRERSHSQCCHKNKITHTKHWMKTDLLNGLMHIWINGPKANSSETEKMIEKVCLKFQQTCRDKRLNAYVVRTTMRVASTQTVEVRWDPSWVRIGCRKVIKKGIWWTILDVKFRLPFQQWWRRFRLWNRWDD